MTTHRRTRRRPHLRRVWRAILAAAANLTAYP